MEAVGVMNVRSTGLSVERKSANYKGRQDEGGGGTVSLSQLIQRGIMMLVSVMAVPIDSQ